MPQKTTAALRTALGLVGRVPLSKANKVPSNGVTIDFTHVSCWRVIPQFGG